jgi:hypothetical protein
VQFSFRTFLEDDESRRIASRDMLLNFLKSELHITDDNVILAMNTTDMDPGVIQKLLARGIVSTSTPDIMHQIRNGITVADLVDALAASPAPLG